MRKNLNNFLKGKIAFNCRTEEDAEDLFKKLKRYRLTWVSKASLDDTSWYINLEYTCYAYINYSDFNKGIVYGRRKNFEEDGISIEIYKKGDFK